MHLRRVVVLPILLLCTGLSYGTEPAIYLGPEAGALERQAASELQRYLYAASKRVVAIEIGAVVPEGAMGYVLGTPATLPNTGEAWPFGLEPPAHDGYLFHASGDPESPLITIAAATARGVQHGVYGFLEELGFGFYLGGDTIPKKAANPADLPGSVLHSSHSPLFAVRGTVPWHNFFNGPMAWELEDYKTYIDQLVHMRLNTVNFHAYDEEPYATYLYEGRLNDGAPAKNTSEPNWGTVPLPSEHFFAGTGQYFDRDYFGAAGSFIEDPAESIQESKRVLAEAMAYAKSRGMRVGLGFEVRGDALEVTNQAGVEGRIKTMLADYPSLDCLWIWQPEGQGLNPYYEPSPPRSQWDSYARRWEKAFADIPQPERRHEAVRMAHYALQAHRVLEATRPDVKLVVSGWGGDAWLRWTDFFPGMDRVLPGDVTLAALDNIRVTPTVSTAHANLSDARQRWPIVWFEYDGDQWMPQPNLYETAGACRDAYVKGCQGFLGIHWRTRDVEEAATYCARFAWNPELSVEEFCERRARDLYGEEAGETVAPYLVELQRLGYRWVGGRGQSEAAPFAWSMGEDEKVAELERIAHDMRAELQEEGVLALVTGLVPDLVAGLADPGRLTGGLVPSPRTAMSDKERALLDLNTYIDYVLAFERAARELAPGEGLDEYVSEEETDVALTIVEESHLAEAMHLYARRIRSKGDLGVLATMNTKAWPDLRTRLDVPDDALARLEELPDDITVEPSVLVLPDRVIVVGLPESNLKVRVHARPLGQKRFVKHPLDHLGRSTFKLSFPEEATGAGTFEYGLVVRKGLRRVLAWPPGFPTRTRVANALPAAPSSPPAAPAPPGIRPVALAHLVVPERQVAVLTWPARPGEQYTIRRDEVFLGTVVDGWFEDTAPPSDATVRYAVEARHMGTGHTATQYATVVIPELPLPQPPEEIHATTRASRVVLGWQSDAPNAVAYSIAKYRAEDDPAAEFQVTAAHGHYLEFSDLAVAGQACTYTVSAIAPDGRVGPPSKRIGVIPSDAPLEPRLQLTFESEEFLQGLAKVAENALALGGSGWAELPPQDNWDPEDELTLSAWVYLDELYGMPVLICKGAWQQSGYFLQFFQGKIRFYVAGVDTLDAGTVRTGRWMHAAATYGSGEMRIYLDGALVGRKRVRGHPIPSATPLLLGRYGDNEDVYFVRGLMDDIRIYDVSLTPEEIAALYSETKRD